MQSPDRASQQAGGSVHAPKKPPKHKNHIMKARLNSTSPRIPLAATWIAALLTFASIGAQPAATPLLLDDYSDPKNNKNGVERLLIDDKAAGSKSQATQKCENGVLTVKGDLSPGRGVPAFISEVSLLSADGKPKDMSRYEGVRLRVKVTKGVLVVQVGSADVQNFDYHTSAPIAVARGEFHEVRVAFKEMKRGWSEQTALNLKSITSVNLVSFGVAKDSFEYAVDEIGFY
jgi:Complex I intermediate-associated protein 30 (CIA30)